MSRAQRHKVAKAQRGSINLVPLCLSASVPNNKGLTLIEVMVVVAILAIIASSIFTIFQGSLLSQKRGTNKALIYSEARAALDMMSREMQQAIVDERIGAHYELWNEQSDYNSRTDPSFTADQFYFVAPTMTDDGVELCEIGYWLQIGDDGDSILQRYYDTAPFFDFTGGSSDALIGNVSDLQFQYWDGSAFTDAPYSVPPSDHLESDTSLIRAVKITLVMEYPTEKDQVAHDTFITVVNIPGSGQ